MNAQPKEVIRTVAAGDPKVIAALEQRGFIILPISTNQNWLSVNSLNVGQLLDEDWDLLNELSPQVVRLKVSGVTLSPRSLEVISQFTELQELALNHTTLQDDDLSHLNNLHNLHSLNITATDVSDHGIEELFSLESIEKIFVFETMVSEAFSDSLNDSGRLLIERGGYMLR